MANISRSKGNQNIRFIQLTKYNIRNIFLEKSCSKGGWETSCRPLSKKLKLKKSLDKKSKVFYGLFLLYLQVDSYQNILKQECRPLGLTSYNNFSKKQKGVWHQFLCFILSMIFFKKNNSHVIFYRLTKFNCPITFSSSDVGQYVCIVTACFPGKSQLAIT